MTASEGEISSSDRFGINLQEQFVCAWNTRSDNLGSATPGDSQSAPEGMAKIRLHNADFQVDELLDIGSSPTSENCHLYLQLRKEGENTHWVAEQIASITGVAGRDVGYSGRKDRYAITTQWFSVPVNSRDAADLDTRIGEQLPMNVELISSAIQPGKLRPGSHRANQFRILLRDIESDPQAIEERLIKIQQNGVPNYFGEQRFGRDRQNVIRGASLLASRRLGRHKQKGMLLSSMRSWIFNRVLSERVRLGRWPTAENLCETGPLWGRGRSGAGDADVRFEREAIGELSQLCELLEFSGLRQERRPLTSLPSDLAWNWHSASHLELKFVLPPGAYATSVLREVCEFEDQKRKQK